MSLFSMRLLYMGIPDQKRVNKYPQWRGRWVHLFLWLVSHKDSIVPQGTMLALDNKINIISTMQCWKSNKNYRILELDENKFRKILHLNSPRNCSLIISQGWEYFTSASVKNFRDSVFEESGSSFAICCIKMQMNFLSFYWISSSP